MPREQLNFSVEQVSGKVGAMGLKAVACKECAQKCLLIHQRKKNSMIGATTFFKVMIGDQFSKFLFLPPKFAATVLSLVDQETFLEDSSGQQWNVTLSNLDGSLAFDQGWSSFALDHGLEIGNFVVFNYVMGSGFVVKIFNTTGCEKIDFPENSTVKKRARINGNSAAKYDQCHKNEGSMNKKASNTSDMFLSEEVIHQSQCEPDDVEEILRAPEDKLHCDGSSGGAKHLAKEEHIAVKDGRLPCDTDTSLNSQLKTCFVVNSPAAIGILSGVAMTDALDFETIEKSHCSKEISKKAFVSGKNSFNTRPSGHLLTTSAMRRKGNKENISDIPLIKGIAESSGAAVSNNDSKIIDQGQSASSDMIAREKYREAKVEPVHLVETLTTCTASLSCLVATESQSFLELPTCLPSSHHGKTRRERRVVFLRDPAMRLWPVLYHERYGFTILTSGWEAFSKTNSIQPGDECIFGVERGSEGIYSVRIARR